MNPPRLGSTGLQLAVAVVVVFGVTAAAAAAAACGRFHWLGSGTHGGTTLFFRSYAHVH